MDTDRVTELVFVVAGNNLHLMKYSHQYSWISTINIEYIVELYLVLKLHWRRHSLAPQLILCKLLLSRNIMKLVVFGILLIISYCHIVNALDVGSPCSVRSGDGTCRLIQDCRIAIDELKNGKYPTQCGFKGARSIVCCPNVDTES